MSLNPSSCASALSAANDSAISTYPSGDFGAAFASAYKAYSTAGVLSATGGVAGTEDESILADFINGLDNRESTITEFATALASYWATCMLTPSAGSITVTNNAMSKVSAFEAAINASYSTTEQLPYYLNFIQNIENVAKTITWVCIKPIPLPPTSETIS
jgi:hypothetical protein